MRKSYLIGILFIVIALSLPVFVTSAVSAAGKDIAVRDAKGDVSVMSQGSTEWKKVDFGMMLSSGDTVKTGADSYVDLCFDGAEEDAIVRLDANTNMKVDSYVLAKQVENKKIILDLAMGDIMVRANKLKNESQFQVRTPTSIVGVRGTGFKVKVSAEK